MTGILDLFPASDRLRVTARRIAYSLFALSAVALCLTGPAAAQNTSRSMSNLAISRDQPIQIESDRLDINEKSSRAVFTGNVKVVQGDMQLRAGAMTVYYASGGSGSIAGGNASIEKIDVSSKVYLKSGPQQATADAGSFNMNSQVFVLTGQEVVLTDGDNVFVGCKLTVRMESGEAKLESCGRRVQIQIDPKSRPKQ